MRKVSSRSHWFLMEVLVHCQIMLSLVPVSLTKISWASRSYSSVKEQQLLQHSTLIGSINQLFSEAVYWSFSFRLKTSGGHIAIELTVDSSMSQIFSLSEFVITSTVINQKEKATGNFPLEGEIFEKTTVQSFDPCKQGRMRVFK